MSGCRAEDDKPKKSAFHQARAIKAEKEREEDSENRRSIEHDLMKQIYQWNNLIDMCGAQERVCHAMDELIKLKHIVETNQSICYTQMIRRELSKEMVFELKSENGLISKYDRPSFFVNREGDERDHAYWLDYRIASLEIKTLKLHAEDIAKKLAKKQADQHRAMWCLEKIRKRRKEQQKLKKVALKIWLNMSKVDDY